MKVLKLTLFVILIVMIVLPVILYIGIVITNFSKSNKSFYYSVTCWDDNRQDKYGNFISSLLDFDIRGH